MESVRHDLVRMVRLQKLYLQITDSLREREIPPAEVQELDEANRQRRDELARIAAERDSHVAELTEVRRRESESQLELEHFQRQRSMVTNEREFTAVISEIDFSTKALHESSERRQALEAELQRLDESLEALRLAIPEEEAAHRDVADRWEQRKNALRDDVHGLAREARALEAELQPANRARFLRLLESKKGVAMAPVIEGSCSLCHLALRPHLQQRVRRAQEIISCEHCHRILYLPDMEGL